MERQAYLKLIDSKSPHVAAAARELGEYLTEKELSEAVKEKLKTHKAGPLPFTDLCSVAEHERRSAAIREGRIKWHLESWCWINFCEAIKEVFSTEKEAIEAGQKHCQVCGSHFDCNVRPIIEDKEIVKEENNEEK